MKRYGTLDEVSNLAAYIVSKQNSYTKGFTFDLSGGMATYNHQKMKISAEQIKRGNKSHTQINN